MESQWLWIPSITEAWRPAAVISSTDKELKVRLETGEEEIIPGPVTLYADLSYSTLAEECDNLVNLESYNEGIIIHHIRKRFSVDIIYTFVGSILVAMNPNKRLAGLYDNHVADRIYDQTKAKETLSPHVFSIASTAVFNMKNDHKDQSVLISGESGAGKTEATKKILQFISYVSSSTASQIHGHSIEDQILASNPLLESFGNAKTIRNRNSSRFGKYMEVNFDKKYSIKGCRVTSYLLEKSRVVKAGPNERNYHIFYMLLCGANKEQRRDLFLKPIEEFVYLTIGKCIEIEGRNDSQEFFELIQAMKGLGIEDNTQNEIFTCLAAILHLGNLQFISSNNIEGGSRISSSAECKRVATLLGLPDSDTLERVLCNVESIVQNELVSVALSPALASDQRDSLAKYVYSRLFDYIVMRVNNSLYRGRPGHTIGVLDIFGFEVFQVNSFEQLCINYCNERLQTFFNEVIFEGERRMFEAEGLPADEIEFQDNIGCVRLVDLRGAGIFAYLDEETAVPKGSDTKLISKLNTLFDESKNTRSPFYIRSRKSPISFGIRHFAGDVTYDATGFLEKNRDTIAESLMNTIRSTSHKVLNFVDPAEAEAEAAAESAGGKKKRTGKSSLSTKFKNDLDSLMTALRATVPHFIRCVTPNTRQAPSVFDAPVALNQLKYSGLFEAIRIRKAGYELRIPFEVFASRYSACLKLNHEERSTPEMHANALLQYLTKLVEEDSVWQERMKSLKSAAASSKKNSRGAVQSQEPPRREYAVGKTKIFLRSAIWRTVFDEIRESAKAAMAFTLTRVARGFIARCRLAAKLSAVKQRKDAALSFLSKERDAMVRADAESRSVEDVFRKDAGLYNRLAEARAARVREEKARIALLQDRAIRTLQRHVRGYFGRTRGRTEMCEKLLSNAITSRDEAKLSVALSRCLKFKVTSPLIRSYRADAKKLMLTVMHEAHITEQLNEAIIVQSLPLIRDAIKVARTNNMTYLPAYNEARAVGATLMKNRVVISVLSDSLSRCTSVPALVARYDILQYLVIEAARRGLVSEAIVSDAGARLGRVKSLYILRQQMRSAVESASPTRIRRTLDERARHLRLYGDEFLAEESYAADRLLGMLKIPQTLLQTVSNDNITSDSFGFVGEEGDTASSPRAGVRFGETTILGGDGSGCTQRLSMHEIWESIIAADGEDSTSVVEKIYLPSFVREALNEMKYAEPTTEDEAVARFTRLVPSAFHRKFYLRIFKWTTAFSTWLKPSQELLDIQKLVSPTDVELRNFEDGNDLNASLQSPNKSSTLKTGFGVEAKSSNLLNTQRTSTSMSLRASSTPMSPKTGPFAQRQSKSVVAAREVLKKGDKLREKETAMQRTDMLLNESLRDNQRFISSVPKPCHWA